MSKAQVKMRNGRRSDGAGAGLSNDDVLSFVRAGVDWRADETHRAELADCGLKGLWKTKGGPASLL